MFIQQCNGFEFSPIFYTYLHNLIYRKSEPYLRPKIIENMHSKNYMIEIPVTYLGMNILRIPRKKHF